VCKALISYAINPEKCIGCGACAKNCPTNAIYETTANLYLKETVYMIDQEFCIKCGSCLKVCPDKAKAVEKTSVKMVNQVV